MSALTLLALIAAADAPARFAIDTESGSFEVTKWSPPPSEVVAGDDTVCRIGLRWTPEGVEATARTCPEAVRHNAVRWVHNAWHVAPPVGHAAPQYLGEVWFVYPSEVDRPVLTWVRQTPEHHHTLPEGVDAVPFAVQAWAFLRYPAEAIEAKRTATCRVTLDADFAGYPTATEVTGCDDPFRSTVRETVSSWRLKPPRIGERALPSGLVLFAEFDPEPPDDDRPTVPGEESHALWAEGQYGQLTREERLWFIRATLLGPAQDLGPGRAHVRMPDSEGPQNDPRWFGDETQSRRPVPPLPDHPPVFLVGRDGRADIEVYAMDLPPAPDPTVAGECELTVQVDGDRAVWAWALSGACTDTLRDWSTRSAEQWVLQHRGLAVPEARERFEATIVTRPDQPPQVWVEDGRLRSGRDSLPDHVHVQRTPTLQTRFPPRIPRRLLEQGLRGGECHFDVEIDSRGRPRHVTSAGCPEGYAPFAERAVRRYRWSPAELDGEAIPGRDEVMIRFAD